MLVPGQRMWAVWRPGDRPTDRPLAMFASPADITRAFEAGLLPKGTTQRPVTVTITDGPGPSGNPPGRAA